jgi:hypothetical protein
VVHVGAAAPDYASLNDESPGWYDGRTNLFYRPGSTHRRLGPSDMRPVAGTVRVTIPGGCTMLRDSVQVHSSAAAEWLTHRAPEFSADGRTATVAFWNHSFGKETVSLTVRYQLPGGTLTQQEREIPAPRGAPKKRLPMGSVIVPLSASYHTFVLNLKFEDGTAVTITPDHLIAAGVQAAVEPASDGKQLRLNLEKPTRRRRAKASRRKVPPRRRPSRPKATRSPSSRTWRPQRRVPSRPRKYSWGSSARRTARPN